MPIGHLITVLVIFSFLVLGHPNILETLSAVPDSVPTRNSWDSFKTTHSLLYSQNEDSFRYFVFRKNLAKAEYLSKINPEAQWGISKFSHLTYKEFAAQSLLPKHQKYPTFPEERYISRVNNNIDSLPQTFDWISEGATAKEARNQGSVGSCYAFSAVEAMAGQKYLANDKKQPLQSLSVEQIVDCGTDTCGMFGGWPYLVYEHIKSVGGVESESAYPYCCGDGKCFPCMPTDYNMTLCGNHSDIYCSQHCLFDKTKVAATISGWDPVAADEDVIQSTMFSNGPLSVCLDATTLQFYKGGVIRPHKDLCDPSDIDHCVLSVGWGQEETIFGDTLKYWIVRNSWGKWGHDDSGNFFIEASYGTGKNVDTCGIDRAVTLPKVPA